MKNKECKVCQKVFVAQTSGKYCSKECFREFMRSKYRQDVIVKRCQICGNPFNGVRQQKNCETCCRKRNRSWDLVEQQILCKKCDNVIKTVYKKNNNRNKEQVRGIAFCFNCREEAMFKIKERMRSDANPSIQKHGRTPIAKYGKYRNYTQEEISQRFSDRMKIKNPMKNSAYVQKMKDTKQQNIKNGTIVYARGEKHWAWNGNRNKAQIIRSRLYKSWVFPKLNRDNFKCVLCSKSRCKLEVHHNEKTFRGVLQEALDLCLIDKLYNTSYPQFELICQVVLDLHRHIDGITLCVDCHKNLDTLRY